MFRSMICRLRSLQKVVMTSLRVQNFEHLPYLGTTIVTLSILLYAADLGSYAMNAKERHTNLAL